MRKHSRIVTGVAAAAVAAGVATFAAGVRADDPGAGGGMPPVQKPIEHPYAKSLVGTWATSSVADWGPGTGKITWKMGVGGTCLLEDYESTSTGPDGKPSTFGGHAIVKVGDDGKSVTMWWIDSHSAEPQKWAGSITDTGWDVTANSPQGPMRITMAKTADGHEFKMSMGDHVVLTEIYKKG